MEGLTEKQWGGRRFADPTANRLLDGVTELTGQRQGLASWYHMMTKRRDELKKKVASTAEELWRYISQARSASFKLTRKQLGYLTSMRTRSYRQDHLSARFF